MIDPIIDPIIDSWIDGWIDGTLTSDELSSLRAALADPAILAAVSARVREHQLLRVACRHSAQVGALRVAADIAQRESTKLPGAAGAPPRRWRWVPSWSSAVAATVLAALGVYTFFTLTLHDRIGVVSDAQAASLRPGAVVRIGDVLTTTAEGNLWLQLDHGHLVHLAAGGLLSAPVRAGEPLVLERGSLDVETTPGHGDSPCVIATPDALATVIGTRFRLQAEAGSTRLTVHEGRVRLTRRSDGKTAEVGAGEHADTALAELVSRPKIAAESRWKTVFDADFASGQLSPQLDTQNGARPPGDSDELHVLRPDAHEFRGQTFALRADHIGADPRSGYTAGFISTAGRLALTYGRYEMRCRFPRGAGLGVVVRLLSERAWPPEIAVVYDGAHPDRLEVGHYAETAGAGDPAIFKRVYHGPDLSQDDHDIVIVWEPGQITWLLDGTVIEKTAQAIPDEPLFLVINLAVGGRWRDAPATDTVFPAYFTMTSLRIGALER